MLCCTKSQIVDCFYLYLSGGHDPFASNTATIVKKRNSIRHESEDPEVMLVHNDKYVSSFGSGTLKENGIIGGGMRGYRKSLSNSWPESHFLPDEGSKGTKKVIPRNGKSLGFA